MRRMFRVVKYCLVGYRQSRFVVIVAAGVVIAIEVGKVAALDIYANSVTGEELIAGRVERNCI